MLKQLLSRDKISEKVIRFIKSGHNVQKPMKMHRFSWKLRAFRWFPLSELYKGKSQQPTRLPQGRLAPGGGYLAECQKSHKIQKSAKKRDPENVSILS